MASSVRQKAFFRPSFTTIKELYDSGALHSAVPSNYRLPVPQPAGGNTPAVEDEIPIIDFSMLTGGIVEQRERTIKALGKACEDWGFFAVVNHGVPSGTVEAMVDATRGFFSLMETEKREYTGNHVLDPIRCGTSFNPAVEDVRCWRDYFKLIVHPDLNAPVTSPGGTVGVCNAGAEDVAGAFERDKREPGPGGALLGDGAGPQLGHATSGREPVPSLPAAGARNGDAAAFGPRAADGSPSERRGRPAGGTPRQVGLRPATAGSLLVNTGDHMEIYSNGRYRSVLHRAVLNNHSTRISIAVVQGPALETHVQPSPHLVSDGGVPRLEVSRLRRAPAEEQAQG